MQKKNNIVLIATIMISVALLIIITAILLIVKDKMEDKNMVIASDVKIYDRTQIEGFLSYQDMTGKNIINESSKRTELINYILTNDEKSTSTPDNIIYISKEEYLKRYKEVFGTIYNANNDIETNISALSKCTETIPDVEDQYCWTNIWNTNGNIYRIIKSDQEYANNVLTVFGDFNILSSDNTVLKEGKFKYTYKVDGVQGYLKSVTLK